MDTGIHGGPGSSLPTASQTPRDPHLTLKVRTAFFFVLEKMWSEYNYLKSKLHLHVCVCVIVCVYISDKAALD